MQNSVVLLLCPLCRSQHFLPPHNKAVNGLFIFMVCGMLLPTWRGCQEPLPSDNVQDDDKRCLLGKMHAHTRLSPTYSRTYILGLLITYVISFVIEPHSYPFAAEKGPANKAGHKSCDGNKDDSFLTHFCYFFLPPPSSIFLLLCDRA